MSKGTFYWGIVIFIGIVFLHPLEISAALLAIGETASQTMVLHSNGTVYTWGSNVYGRLGNNSTVNSYFPVKVLKGEYNGSTYLGDDPDNQIIQVVMGSNPITIAENGLVYTWGGNAEG